MGDLVLLQPRCTNPDADFHQSIVSLFEYHDHETCTCDLALIIITISDTFKNQPQNLDSDNQIIESRLTGTLDPFITFIDRLKPVSAASVLCPVCLHSPHNLPLFHCFFVSSLPYSGYHPLRNRDVYRNWTLNFLNSQFKFTPPFF
jgi:hypothetical protein